MHTASCITPNLGSKITCNGDVTTICYHIMSSSTIVLNRVVNYTSSGVYRHLKKIHCGTLQECCFALYTCRLEIGRSINILTHVEPLHLSWKWVQVQHLACVLESMRAAPLTAWCKAHLKEVFVSKAIVLIAVFVTQLCYTELFQERCFYDIEYFFHRCNQWRI